MTNLEKIHFVIDRMKTKYESWKERYFTYEDRLEELNNYLWWSIDKDGDLDILHKSFFKAIVSDEYPALFNKLTDEDRAEMDFRNEMEMFWDFENEDWYASSEYAVKTYVYDINTTLDKLVEFFSNEENMKVPNY